MRRVVVGVVLGLLSAAAGCGPAEVRVSGNVTLDGRPLEEGNIAFRPLPESAKAEATVGTIKGGKYEVKARPGRNRVEITAVRVPPGPKNPFGVPPPPVNLVPARYNVDSELKEEVKAGGPNEFNFTLTTR